MAEPLAIKIRPCFEMDLQFVQLIYAHHVMTGAGTFEIEPPSVEEMRARWMRIAVHEWPFVVACGASDPTRIHGFAYAAQFRDRPAYSNTFEDSVYVARHAMGRGVGSALLGEVLGQLETMKARQVVAMIGDSANAASVRLHLRTGFFPVGVLTGVGVKFGRSLDVVVMQRTLTAGAL